MKTLAASAFVVLLAAPLGAGGRSLPHRLSLLDASGVPYAGVELSLVGLDTGRVVRVRSDRSGTAWAVLDAGDYAIDLGRTGLEIDRGPRILHVTLAQPPTTLLRLEEVHTAGGAALRDAPGDSDGQGDSYWLPRLPKKCHRPDGQDDERWRDDDHRRHPRPRPCPVSPSR